MLPEGWHVCPRCRKPTDKLDPDYEWCPACAREADAEMERMETNEAAAIIDSMHRYGWCYE